MSKSHSSQAGQIHLLHDGKRTQLLSYQAPPKKAVPKFEDLFIQKFDHFGFTDEEKKVLSMKHRKAIYHYQENHNVDFEMSLEKLIKKINGRKEKNLVIVAESWGAQLTFAALFSGKIDPNKSFHLEFKDSPLALIPKSFYKCLKPKNLSLHLEISPDSWLQEIKSIVKPTTHNLIKKLKVA